MIKVYHGSTVEIRKPDVKHGRDNLDFGKAFYLTRLKRQAEHWARVVYSRYEEDAPVVNTYNFDLEAVVQNGFKMLVFDSYNQEWLDFIVASRSGRKPWADYDIIEGGVANDRVIDTVEGYMAGDFSAEVAIGRLQYHKPNNQIAILNQEIVNKFLVFERAEQISADE